MDTTYIIQLGVIYYSIGRNIRSGTRDCVGYFTCIAIYKLHEIKTHAREQRSVNLLNLFHIPKHVYIPYSKTCIYSIFRNMYRFNIPKHVSILYSETCIYSIFRNMYIYPYIISVKMYLCMMFSCETLEM